MNDKDEKTFLLAEAIGEAEEKYIAEEKKLGRMKAGTKAGIFFAVLLAAALILGGVASLKAKARRAKWRTEPAVTFSELSPQVFYLLKTESFEDADGVIHAVTFKTDITDEEEQRRILALLDEAKLISLQSQLDYYSTHERSRELSDSVELHIEEDGLIYRIGLNYAEIAREDEPKLDIRIVLPEQDGKDGEQVAWVYKAEKEPCLRLFDELWEYFGGGVAWGDILSDGYSAEEIKSWTRPEHPLAPDDPLYAIYYPMLGETRIRK